MDVLLNSPLPLLTFSPFPQHPMERLPFGVTTPSCVEVTRVPEISFIICIRIYIYIYIHKYACVDFVDYCRF